MAILSHYMYMYLQYCAKVMQTNFDKIPGFSKKFRLKQYFDEIFPHFRDTYCFDSCDVLNDNSLCSIIHPKISNDNSLSWKVAAIFRTIIRSSWKFDLLFINKPRAVFVSISYPS